MPNVLHITNGDSSVHIMRQANISGDFLPWRDVLHEGPVPGHLSLADLSAVRAEFISGRDWGQHETILDSFIERDSQLGSYADYDEVILWFEHDLYDQLQILQILNWFASDNRQMNNLSIICTNQYLGLLSPEQMSQLTVNKVPVSQEMLLLASSAWLAFTHSTPLPWCELLRSDLSALPFLKDAVIRMLEEYPSLTTGLSRTALQALSIIAKEPLHAHNVFKQNQNMEQSIFMGDSSFRFVLLGLLDSQPALITTSNDAPLEFPRPSEQQLTITETGRKVLVGEEDFLSFSKIDRWIGGVHLQPHSGWRWDASSQNIVADVDSTI